MHLLDFPSELIDSVVSELELDHSSLKSIALANSAFRIPAQRILLRALTLSAYTPAPFTYAGAAALLSSSPHIAEYIRDLTIHLAEPPAARADFPALATALGRCTQVRSCVIDGRDANFRWGTLSPDLMGVGGMFLRFFASQPLRELRLKRLVDVPPALFLGAAPSLYFWGVSSHANADIGFGGASAGDGVVVGGSSADIGVEGELTKLTVPVQQLVLDVGSEKIYDVFNSPAVLPTTSALRRLSMHPAHPLCRNIIAMAAGSLEHLQLNGGSTSYTFALALPPLPALRVIEFVVRLYLRHHITWPLETVAGCVLAPVARVIPSSLSLTTAHAPTSVSPTGPAPSSPTATAAAATRTSSSTSPSSSAPGVPVRPGNSNHTVTPTPTPTYGQADSTSPGYGPGYGGPAPGASDPSSPHLHTIIFSYSTIAGVLPPAPDPKALSALDDALQAHPADPPIGVRWRLRYTGPVPVPRPPVGGATGGNGFGFGGAEDGNFTPFARLVRAGMPRTSSQRGRGVNGEESRITFEEAEDTAQYSLDHEWFELSHGQ
ncbi:hypothetical protein C8R43DRAFT_1235247 [Mycena crocata]|nr:hypothetical protein C8R43DRAFT_1235247 [Mycena crocata]